MASVGFRRIAWCSFVAGWFLAYSGGCGGSRFDRFPVQGTVSFKGQTVESGAVFFEPTAAAGKEAPTVYLRIEKGQFSVGRKDGPGRGKYTVVVGGWDKAKEFVDDDGITHSVPLFKDYRFEVEFPVPNNTLNIEVPESQALN